MRIVTFVVVVLVKAGIGPQRSLLEKSTKVRLANFVSSPGISPVRLFLAIVKDCSCVREEMPDEIVPERFMPAKLRAVMFPSPSQVTPTHVLLSAPAPAHVSFPSQESARVIGYPTSLAMSSSTLTRGSHGTPGCGVQKWLVTFASSTSTPSPTAGAGPCKALLPRYTTRSELIFFLGQGVGHRAGEQIVVDAEVLQGREKGKVCRKLAGKGVPLQPHLGEVYHGHQNIQAPAQRVAGTLVI